MQLTNEQVEALIRELDQADTVQKVRFEPLTAPPPPEKDPFGWEVLGDVPLALTVVLGNATLTLRQVLDLGEGSLIVLDKLAGEPADLMVNGCRIGQGEVLVINEVFGVRVSAIA